MSEYKANPCIQKAVDGLLQAITAAQGTQFELKDAGYRDGQVVIVFSDGREITANAFDLRANCQCASCVSELTGKRVLDIKKIPADINPKEILPLGNYAVGITWSDGHASGIYPYSLFK